MQRPIRLLRAAAVALVVGLAPTLVVACSGDGGNGNVKQGGDGAPALTFALDAVPDEIDEEFRVLPHQALGEDFEPVEGETYAMQGRVKQIRSSLFAVELIDDSKVQYNPAMPEQWIYCCADQREVQANLINVRFVRDGEATPVSITDQTKPSFRLVDLITVIGTFTKQSDGTPVFLATGYVIDERPELGDHVDWPQS